MEFDGYPQSTILSTHSLSDELLQLRPIDEITPTPHQSPEVTGGRSRLGPTGLLGAGGWGRLVSHYMLAQALYDGLALDALLLDNDHLALDPIVLPDARRVEAP